VALALAANSGKAGDKGMVMSLIVLMQVAAGGAAGARWGGPVVVLGLRGEGTGGF
jgi:hypothetical protein